MMQLPRIFLDSLKLYSDEIFSGSLLSYSGTLGRVSGDSVVVGSLNESTVPKSGQRLMAEGHQAIKTVLET